MKHDLALGALPEADLVAGATSTCSVTCWPFTKVPNREPLSRSTKPPRLGRDVGVVPRDVRAGEAHRALAAPAERGDVAVQLDPSGVPSGREITSRGCVSCAPSPQDAPDQHDGRQRGHGVRQRTRAPGPTPPSP